MSREPHDGDEAEDFGAEDLADELAGGPLGDALRRHYAALLAEPVPDRFLVLLAELEAKEARRSPAAGPKPASAVSGDPPPDQCA